MTQPVEMENKEILREANKNEPVITHSMVNASPSHQGIDRIIDIEHYNNIMSLLCVTTYVIRFVNNLKTSQRNLKELRGDELKNTKTLWIKSVQTSAFIEELSSKPERPQSHTSYLSNTIWTLPKTTQSNARIESIMLHCSHLQNLHFSYQPSTPS